ncbi:hypothetical protein [Pseudomonas sp. LFM046]|uniref:hypothetical protein n=1 Tax=Pseudomonas sp. LFM046 TaxID=1608357 RepID=UPI0005CFD9B5|nr:hypothetical protein [Pseudomonas sp. LFM046]
MDLSIQEIAGQGGQVWMVEACGRTFLFSSRAAAQAFAEKLRERVDAPHRIPDEVLQRWAVEHERMLRDP